MSTFLNPMALASDIYQGLEAHWDKATAGIYRPGYSPQENEAIETIAIQATAMGMESSFDASGNAHFIYPGQDRGKPVLMIGSHVDAVPSGGRYDGTAGIVAGMAALRHLHETGKTPPQDVCITVFRGEESAWFGMSCMGSKFVTGELGAAFLKSAKHKETGRALAYHMQQCGIDADALATGLRAGQVFPLDRIGNYIEVHIEQGPALLQAQKSLGIVTAIRGHVRYPDKIAFYGEAAHSGSTPQDMRKDAAIAAAGFVSHWARAMKTYAATDDLVFSVPDIHVEKPSSTTIPSVCFVQPEVRTTSGKVLKAVQKKTRLIYDQAVREWNLNGGVCSKPLIGKPAFMDKTVQGRLEETAVRLGIPAMRMPSGAGHDAGILANAGVPCGMLFIRHGGNGISHNADELLGLDKNDNPFAPGSDFCNAVQVLADFMVSGIRQTGKRFDSPFNPAV